MEIGRSICDIYPKEIELKVDHQGDHATSLNLDITIKYLTFIYKLFNKRDSFPFLTVITRYIESNNLQNNPSSIWVHIFHFQFN